LRRIAASGLWPHVEAAGSYTRERTSKNGTSAGSAGRTFNLFQAGFDANWELDVFGGIRRSVEAADASVQAAEEDRNAVLVSLLAEVGLDYVTYRSLQQRIALANQNVAAQQGTLDLTGGSSMRGSRRSSMSSVPLPRSRPRPRLSRSWSSRRRRPCIRSAS